MISMFEIGGVLIGGLVLVWCFNVGMKKLGFWIGLLWFYVVSFVVVVIGVLMFVIKLSMELSLGVFEEIRGLYYYFVGEEEC